MEAARGARGRVVAALAAAGCVSPEEEAADILATAAGDGAALAAMLARRCRGEPLSWVTGWCDFAGVRVKVRPGVYEPRRQTWPLAERAAQLLPEGGLAADLCTGSGAVAVYLARARPAARVVATDVDPVACRCAAGNGVEVFCGHVAEPVPAGLAGRFDVVVAVVPYVPTAQIDFLPRDVREREPRVALDGGPDGACVLRQVVAAGPRLLRRGGHLLVELGGEQDELLASALAEAGFTPGRRLVDDEGDLRGMEATLAA
jgi:release factor glutamine methyltransferase